MTADPYEWSVGETWSAHPDYEATGHDDWDVREPEDAGQGDAPK